MRKRIRQFFSAIRAKEPSEREKILLQELLPLSLQIVFLLMNRANQRHSLQVLYTAQKLYLSRPKGDKSLEELLYRCCLIHDIGKGARMGPWQKSIAVCMDKCIGQGKIKKQALKLPYIGRILQRYYYHPDIAMRILYSLGFEVEGRIILQHHQRQEVALSQDEEFVLDILQKADALN